MKKLLSVIISAVMLISFTACQKDEEIYPERHEPERNTHFFTTPASFRILHGPSVYNGISGHYQSFDTDTVYFGEQVHDGDRISEVIYKKVTADNKVKVFCEISGCPHDSIECPACLENVFTIGDTVYAGCIDYDNGGITIVKSDGTTKTTIGTDELFRYETSVMSTDGTDLFWLVQNDRQIDLRKFSLADGTVKTVRIIYEDSAKIEMYSEKGALVKGSVLRNSEMRIEDISSDGKFMVFSYEFLPMGTAQFRVYCLWDIERDSFTYLNVDNGAYEDFFYSNGTILRIGRLIRPGELAAKSVYETDSQWVDLDSTAFKGREVTRKYGIDDKIVLNLYSATRNETTTALVVDTSDMSVSTLSLRFPAYTAKYYRSPDIFAVTENDVIVGIENNGAGRVRLARMSKSDYFNSVRNYDEIATFSLM